MRIGLITLCFLSFISSPAMPGRVDESAETVAALFLEFVHVATPEQRIALRRVIEDPATTAANRTLAQGLLRVLHVPHPEDVPTLRGLMTDSSQSRLARSLARIILQLVHMPTAQQREAVRGALLFDSSRQDVQTGQCATSYRQN
jgi:hypothetical protein